MESKQIWEWLYTFLRSPNSQKPMVTLHNINFHPKSLVCTQNKTSSLEHHLVISTRSWYYTMSQWMTYSVTTLLNFVPRWADLHYDNVVVQQLAKIWASASRNTFPVTEDPAPVNDQPIKYCTPPGLGGKASNIPMRSKFISENQWQIGADPTPLYGKG